MSDDLRKPVGLTIVERPDVKTRVQHSAASWIAVEVLRPAWLWRRELLLLAVPVLAALGGAGAVWAAVGLNVNAVLGAGLLAGGAAGVLLLGSVCVPVVRTALRVWLSHARVRRHWDRACRFSGLETVAVRVPRVMNVTDLPTGNRLRIRLPRGHSAADLEAGADRLAAALDVRAVRVHPNPDAARWPDVDILRKHPFRDEMRNPMMIRSPLVGADRWSLWDGVPVGMDDMGSWVQVGLPGRNVLVGGEPEAGKSVAVSSVLAAAALDPDVLVLGIDGKQVELGLWVPVLSAPLAVTIEDACALLDDLVVTMDGRYAKLAASGTRVITRNMGLPLVLLVVDELRLFTAHPDRKLRDRFNRVLTDVVARGRAAGIIAVCATQKPSSDVVPTSLRDLFGYRWVLRCSTRDASDTVLGAGWASEGHNAATIAPEDRGLGLLLAEGGVPASVKAAFLSDGDIGQVVARGAALRDGGRT
ncbi:FtsK/SpoIIIE family protein [Murinocardiopsis flavida]|uniref:FtsK/SpoIIIE family protein n=1 Tax=Murinocardiopsis flavida TaxID=645275 RepID=A0A2P8C6W6_9ACTN|nr:FtsK/SpoIIIE domain-containing protein [Murinocardiopsis flavida]PSK80704.1 FtsK/SpoIIIE family protein [Murinocardiopsis flavida]